MTRRVSQILGYIAEHQTGFYRRDMCRDLSIGEEPSRQWLASFEEAGLVWRWRKWGNDPFLWTGTFALRRRAKSARGMKGYFRPLPGSGRAAQ